MVFIKSDVKRPMQFILDAPIRAYRLQEAFGPGETGDLIPVFTTALFTHQTLGPILETVDRFFQYSKPRKWRKTSASERSSIRGSPGARDPY